ncbi:MAG TPA: DUF542 domain-containing protein [Candidatus Polarisedimenticolia bacterium]|jgi:uncharacterized protein involved in response to NO|nr:DUF542 domain-containing protein [Candidatus Polarisedimenticolia bacterium]
MSIDPRKSVAEIVNEHPAVAPVLARFGLDTCCGGKHPLEMAARAHKVDLAEVLRAIDTALPAASVSSCGGGGGSCGCGSRKRSGIDPQSSVRDILAAHPAAAAVLARHGLMGCGGREGPDEPLAWFARVHGVPVTQLIEELEAAAGSDTAGRSTVAEGATNASTAPSPDELARENLYRRFLKTAILFTLTGGTALGAWALTVMALRERLGGVDRGVIQVHGHWQLFGWVGLFVVGVAYHILPRLTGVPLPSPRAAAWSYGLLASGIVLRFAQAIDPGVARSLLLPLSAALEIGGVALFVWTVAKILGATPRPRPAWQRYGAHGTGWLVAASLLNAAHAFDLLGSGRFEIAPWLNVPYLTVFLVGFVTFWIFGVSLRTLPVFMGLRDRPRLAAGLVMPLSAAVATLAIAEGLFLRDGTEAARLAFGIGSAAVGLLLALFVFALGVLAPSTAPPEPGVDRGSEKFIRLAYAWLLVSGGMLLVFSRAILSGAGLDHALVGAYRHALTVGFITTLMAGMALRIVPIFRGVPLFSPRLRDWTFWLLAVGNTIRVVFQALSATNPAWLRVAGVSGMLELAALILFAVNLWKTMDTRNADDRDAAATPAIGPGARVADLLDAYPALLPVFVGSGFAPLANPVLRRTLARGVSVAQACRMHGVDLESFLGRLRRAAGGPISS